MNEYSNIEYLIQQLISGNEDAWFYFIKRYSGLIYYCINRILNVNASKEDKEDCFQEILKAFIEDDYRRLKQIHSLNERSFCSWLGSVANRQTLNKLRGKTKTFFLPEEILDFLPDPSALPDTEALRGQIMDFIQDKLPEEERLVIMLSLNRLTLKEISQIMGLRVRQVFNIKQKAISKLKDLFGNGEKFSNNVSYIVDKNDFGDKK